MAKAIRLLIKNGTLIDGSGGDPVPNRLLVVEGNRITLVGETDGSMRPETPDDTVIDATGKFILPGLIDAHCHISLHQGALPSVKYTSTAEFCTLWAAHAIGRVLRAGVTSIAVPGGKWFTDVTVREAVEGGLLEIIAKAGMPLAPVLTSPWIGVEHGGAGRGLGDRVRDRLRAQLDTSFQMLRNARDCGISVISGSDTGNASAFSHGRWHGKEAELFVKEVGMPPMEAIVANTSRNAWLMGLEGEVGVIAPGKLADIVIWNSDPLADITVLQRPSEISTIIKDGRVVDRKAGGFRQLPGKLPRARASISG
jgi:imidazolonepropionase-like amidohydrolase